MPRAPTTTIRVSADASVDLHKTAERLGVSVGSLIAGFASWTTRAGMPIELRQAIDDAANDAVERWADGARKGQVTRGQQITANGGPRNP